MGDLAGAALATSSGWLPLLPVMAWCVLLVARGGFWRADVRLPGAPVAPRETWPTVAALVPARDEAATVGAAVGSLLTQSYPGELTVTLIDDVSRDGTADAARAAASGAPRPLIIVEGGALEPGWSGKLWALEQGVRQMAPVSGYWLLTDADIVHAPDLVARLVALAESEQRDMVSGLVRLDLGSVAARLLIPAFDFFFQKLYPFAWVADRCRSTAAAAGGCLLVRADALARAGGIRAVRAALIDDCALARAVKDTGGHLWLGLVDDSVSLRPNRHISQIWRMIARTAFTQLNYSALALIGTLAGMALLYLVPPLAFGWGLWRGEPLPLLLGGLGWGLMTFAYAPSVRRHRLSPLWALALPVSAALYVLMTVDSARRHWVGQGAAWKGRQYPSSSPGV